jgi:hypothetical protein
MDNKVWQWLIHTRKTAYQAMRDMHMESSCDHCPTWCFDRFGRSAIELADRRTIYRPNVPHEPIPDGEEH